MRTLMIALALACAPAALSAQQGGQQTRVPAGAAREVAELKARQPAKSPQPALRAGRDAVIVAEVRKQKARPGS